MRKHQRNVGADRRIGLGRIACADILAAWKQRRHQSKQSRDRREREEHPGYAVNRAHLRQAKRNSREEHGLEGNAERNPPRRVAGASGGKIDRRIEYAEAQPGPDPAMFGLPTADDGTRTDPLLGQNVVTCTHYEPDFDALRAASTRIVMAAGAESKDQMAYRGAFAVAERLDTEPVIFPSGHAGFLGLERIRELWRDELSPGSNTQPS